MRTLQRIAALCLVAVLSALLFYFGREHQIFLDNRTIEVGEENFRALKLVRVTVNDAAPVELMPRDRDLVKVVGPSFRFRVEVMDEFGEEVEKVMERELRLGFTKDVMLSMPLMASDRDDWILPPPTVRAPSQERDTPASGEENLIPEESDGRGL